MKRKLAIGCLAPVLVALLAAGVFAYRQQRYIESVYARAQAMGVPTTYAELEAMYPMPPEGENAAELYREAFARVLAVREGWDAATLDAYNRTPVVGRGSIDPAMPWPDEVIRGAQTFCEESAEAMALARIAVERGECRFIDDFSGGPSMELTHLFPARRLAELLLLEACIAAQNGAADQALEGIAAAIRIADALRNDPLIISHIASASVRRKSAQVAETLIEFDLLDAAQTGRLLAMLQTPVTPGMLITALHGEVVLIAEEGRPISNGLDPSQADRMGKLMGEERFARAMAPFDRIGAAHGIEAALNFIDAIENQETLSVQTLDALAVSRQTTSIHPAAPNLESLIKVYSARLEANERLVQFNAASEAAP